MGGSELESREMSREEARERVNRVRGHVKAAFPDLIALYQGQAWKSLGYSSWVDLCRSEWQGAAIALPVVERREVVAQMTDAGMSTRAIAAAVGVSHQTAANDQAAAVKDLTPEPRTVQGIDGKTYTRAPVVHITDAGEVPDDEPAEVLEALQRVIDQDQDIRRLNISREALRWMNHVSEGLRLIDPSEAAAACPDEAERLQRLADRMTRWVADFNESTDQGGTVLRLIEGDSK